MQKITSLKTKEGIDTGLIAVVVRKDCAKEKVIGFKLIYYQGEYPIYETVDLPIGII